MPRARFKTTLPEGAPDNIHSLATVIGDEIGDQSGLVVVDGEVYINAVFHEYGGEVVGIHIDCLDILPDLEPEPPKAEEPPEEPAGEE